MKMDGFVSRFISQGLSISNSPFLVSVFVLARLPLLQISQYSSPLIPCSPPTDASFKDDDNRETQKEKRRERGEEIINRGIQKEKHREMQGGNRKMGSPSKAEKEPFHVIHKVPSGDSPYVRAKYVQLVLKDPEAAIVLFWKAINAGDRVDSALKDMAVVMKQQDRAEEAIEAIKSFRDRCSKQAQESLDNVLIDLYKKCGRIDEQIELLKQKLRLIYQGEAFNGKPTKTARSHGKKFQVSIKQETSRILGNLGWAYMQQKNYVAAEIVYRKAQMIDPDANKACNLGLCLMKQARYDEARSVLEDVLQGRIMGWDDSKSRTRAEELIKELESVESTELLSTQLGHQNLEEAFAEGIDQLLSKWTPLRSRRLPIFEEISQFRDQVAC